MYDSRTCCPFALLPVYPPACPWLTSRYPLRDEVGDAVRLPERERRFLGCVRVPLSTVYQLQVLEGTFKLESPPVVLGYIQVGIRLWPGSPAQCQVAASNELFS